MDDFERLAGLLASYGLPVRIGFEATGNYHRPLAHHLGRAGFELKLVSSVALARTACNSWYVDARGVNRAIFPGLCQDDRRHMATFDPADYAIVGLRADCAA